MRSLVCAATATLLALPAAAPGQINLPPEVTDGFYVTIEEIRANGEEVFDALAGPEGGPITREQMVRRDLPEDLLPQMPDRKALERLFKVLDGDGDGQVTRAEWNRRIDADLEFADENEDGRITLKELVNARENLGLGEALGMMF